MQVKISPVNVSNMDLMCKNLIFLNMHRYLCYFSSAVIQTSFQDLKSEHKHSSTDMDLFKNL